MTAAAAHTAAATQRMMIIGRSMRSFSCCFRRICARHQTNPGLGSSGRWSSAICLRRKSSLESSLMSNTNTCPLKQALCFFACAEDDHAHALFFYADHYADLPVAQFFNMSQPQDSPLLSAEFLEDRCHVQRQTEVLIDCFVRNAELPPFFLALQPATAVAQDVGRRLIEISLARQVAGQHGRRVEQPDVSFL